MDERISPVTRSATARQVAGAQRVEACGRIAVKQVGGRTRLDVLHQEGAAKIRMPRVAGQGLEAVLINTAGGLTGGDRLAWQVEAGPGASLEATTQACEKIYRASEGCAEVTCRMSAASGAWLAWLPQETILFDRAALSRRIEADLADDAEALIVESCIFGRQAMGERVARATFRDRWRVRRGGRLVHAEDFAIGPDVADTLSLAAAGGGRIAFATVLLVAPDAADRLEDIRRLLGPADGASAWQTGGTGKLLARLAAGDGLTLRRRLIPVIKLLNKEAAVPKVWAI